MYLFDTIKKRRMFLLMIWHHRVLLKEDVRKQSKGGGWKTLLKKRLVGPFRFSLSWWKGPLRLLAWKFFFQFCGIGFPISKSQTTVWESMNIWMHIYTYSHDNSLCGLLSNNFNHSAMQHTHSPLRLTWARPRTKELKY